MCVYSVCFSVVSFALRCTIWEKIPIYGTSVFLFHSTFWIYLRINNILPEIGRFIVWLVFTYAQLTPDEKRRKKNSEFLTGTFYAFSFSSKISIIYWNSMSINGWTSANFTWNYHANPFSVFLQANICIHT